MISTVKSFKKIQGQNLFTLESAGTSRPVVREEIRQILREALDSMEEGQILWFPSREFIRHITKEEKA